MNQSIADEIESCIKAVPALSNVQIVWGTDPTKHRSSSDYPRVGVYADVPVEREVFPDESRMAYAVKIGYYMLTDDPWPRSKEAMLSQQAAAKAIRDAVRNIYARQISGDSSEPIDLEGGVEQEISQNDRELMIGTAITLLVLE